jgi:GTPase SAR1 family protein
VKILTLGVGDSGKSTIWRQLKRIYCGGFGREERLGFASAIRENILSDVKCLVNVIDRDDSVSLSEDLAFAVKTIRDAGLTGDDLVPDLARLISQLWSDPIIPSVYQMASFYGIGDNAAFFLDNVERISDPDYVPTDDDIIRSRIRTTGVLDLKFEINDVKTLLVDVGGQVSERVRWQECFQGVDYLLFVVSLSDFDLMMFEDETMSRTRDSKSLFKKMADSPLFSNTPIFFVMNKIDLFRWKLQMSPDAFRATYPGFEGDMDNLDQAVLHVWESYFDELASDRAKGAWIRYMPLCAMEADDIKRLFAEISDSIMNRSPII